MGTLVCFHAHPDDEAIATGGIIARAADEGHRVVLVVATDGAHGQVPDDLGPEETLVDRRRAETERSAEVLGIARVVWLDYTDSGMHGWEQNHHDTAFWQADVDEAAWRLAEILREESTDVLTVYDWHGVYGHPDHLQVHRVGRRAAQIAQVPRVLDATVNRDHMAALFRMAKEADMMVEAFDPEAPMDDGNPFGLPEAEITLAVDVTAWAERKRASIRCHASQIDDSAFFSQMPLEVFTAAFGTEWFVETPTPEGWSGGPHTGWIFP
jgi:LmbE family N-acetylglucosaminyl deacetylase